MNKLLENLKIYKDDKIIILGHNNPDVDSIISGYLLEKLLKEKGYNIEFIIPDKYIEKESLNICLKHNLNPTSFQKNIELSNNYKYILIDHNDRKTSGEIIAIIDHHSILENNNCNNSFIEPYSSTTCMICKGNEKYFSKEDLELAFLGAFVDTVSFHSLKGRPEDLEWIKYWCNNLNIDYNSLYKEGLCLTSIDNINKTYLNGHKNHKYMDYKIESSYIQIENPELKKHTINEIIELIQKYVIENKLDIFVFIVHDMTKFQSKVYIIKSSNISVQEYDFYAPRGNVIIPNVIKILKK